MSYLLDTHVLLWWLMDNPNLSEKARTIISDSQNIIFVSSASSWEITLKKSIGKLEAPDNLATVIETHNLQPLPITIAHTIFINKLPKYHEDPFDRILIAQAITEGLTIITRDMKIEKYPVSIVKA